MLHQKLEIGLTKFKGNRTHLQRRVKKASSFVPSYFQYENQDGQVISVGLGACQESKFVVGNALLDMKRQETSL
jgi:hypothetical protein